MKSIIHELPQEVVVKIAAGEVITGTFAVMKELLENAADAHADDIKAEIRNGGKSLIKLSDNGFGMSLEDIYNSVKPHATSKISSAEDLYKIQTFGFRGEALSSICQVSRMSISSRTLQEETGHKVTFIAGKVVSESVVNMNPGTIIEIEDIFFNIPARRKFLKSDSAEGRMTTEIIEKFILSNKVSLSYVRDGKSIYEIRKEEDLQTRFRKVFPELKAEDIIYFEEDGQWIKVHGYITKPIIARLNRTGQIFYVNNRYVRSAELFSVFEGAYSGMLQTGKHPYCAVFIDVLPQEVDVNVHPQKLEVKFSDQTSVNKLLIKALKSALEDKVNFTLNLIKEDVQPYLQIHEQAKDSSVDALKTSVPIMSRELERTQERFFQKPFEKYSEKNTYVSNNQSDSILAQPSKPSEHEPEYSLRIIGFLSGRYIISEENGKMILTDFHAAHERILYEEFKRDFFGHGSISCQYLLLPQQIELDKTSMEYLAENTEKIKKFGIDLDIQEDGKLLVKALPHSLEKRDIQGLIEEVVAVLRLHGIEPMEKIFEEILATMACRTAVKTNDDFVGAQTLLEKLHKKGFKTCPHGRPISMELEIKKIDSYFGR
ncbi:MAG TPA: DNA mismatch repair endonuclease MutL [Petrotogaceae bacterium]|nr:DNA mismatch repair endonuclease MutL [Petrotogaceae bacterium]